MTTPAALLIAAHVICTTLGYGGLIVGNVALAFVARRGETQATAAATSIIIGRFCCGGFTVGNNRRVAPPITGRF